jgi:predicted nucleic acid-binding protein
MSVEPGLIDANILVYAADTGAVHHAASRRLLAAARNPATVLYLTSQVLCHQSTADRCPLFPYRGS